MNVNVAIDPALTPFKDYLKGKGMNVQSVDLNRISSTQKDSFDAYVVTGLDTDFMGMMDTKTKAMVVEASGKTPEQVYNELQSGLRR